MISKRNTTKIATDLTWVQLSWSAWFLAIVLIVYIAFRMIGGDVVINNQSLNQQSFLTFAFRPSKVYMLVIGIISVSGFLTFFVKQGMTRKDYFYGAAISTFILSLSLMVVAGVVSLVEQFIFPTAEIGSFLGPETSWLLTVVVFSLNILVYNVGGWLIGAGFYRYGGLGGMLYIVLALILIALSDVLWEFELKNPLESLLNLGNQWPFPLYVSFFGTFLLVAFALWMIRMTTKRVFIKMK